MSIVVLISLWPRRSLIWSGCAPASISHAAHVCRRSWLCRRRHKHEYADSLVMPISSANAWCDGLIAA